jgi:hypothetical protein
MSEFNFPNACARCGKNEPDTGWKVKCSEMVLHEPELGMQSMKTFNDFIIDVPICTGCERSLKRWGALCWPVGLACGLMAGVAAGFALAANTELKLPGIYLGASVIGLFAAAIVGVGMQIILSLVGILSFAEYRPRESKMQFRNKDYQQHFDRLNFTTHLPPTRAQQEQWARPWA